MKKTLCILLCVCLAAGSVMTGCGSKSSDASDEVILEPVGDAPADAAENTDTDEGDGGYTGDLADGAGENAEIADGAEAAEEGAAEGETAAIPEYTNFSGGALIDDEEGNRFEITSMGMDEIGYKMNYTMAGSGFLWLNYCAVNGIRCGVVRDSVQDDQQSGDRYLYIPKEWLDTLGMTDVRSIQIKFSIGSVAYSSYTANAEAEAILYTGEKDDTPYEPVLSDTSRTIYEDENVSIILVDGETYYNSGNLIRQNFGVLYLKKSDADMDYRVSKVNFGELYSYVESTDPNSYSFDMTAPGNGFYINEVWNTDSDRDAWNQADLSNAEVIISVHDMDTYEEKEVPVIMDLTLPEKRL